MTTQEKISDLVKKSDTNTLIKKLKEIRTDFTFMSLNVAIQEELENRIGEDGVDAILYEGRD